MKLVIGLTGTMNSGKGTIAEYIVSKEFEHFILSEIIKEETSQKHLPLTRENLQDIGDILRREHGLGVLAKLALERAKTDRILIDGIRNPGEIAFLKQVKDVYFVLIAVDAPLAVRFARAKERKSAKDIVDYATFVRDDARDRGINQPENGQQVQACVDAANYQIINDGRAFAPIVDRILQDISRKYEHACAVAEKQTISS